MAGGEKELHARNSKETDAIQARQPHSAGCGAGPNDHKRLRAADAKNKSAAGGSETSAHAGRTRTAEEARRRLQGGDQKGTRSKGDRPLGRHSADADSRCKKEAAI